MSICETHSLNPQHHFQQRPLVLVLVLDPWHTQCVAPFTTRCPISMIRTYLGRSKQTAASVPSLLPVVYSDM